MSTRRTVTGEDFGVVPTRSTPASTYPDRNLVRMGGDIRITDESQTDPRSLTPEGRAEILAELDEYIRGLRRMVEHE